MKLRVTSLLALFVIPALVMGCGGDAASTSAPDTTAPLAPVISGARAGDTIVGIWWDNNVEPDLAGYNIYSVENGTVRKVNQVPQVSNYYTYKSDSPLVQVFVTAIDWSGNESGPSQSRNLTLIEVGDQIEGIGEKTHRN